VDLGTGPAVGFTLTDEAGERFRQYTRDHIDTGLAIVLDGEVISSPLIRSEIGEKGIITGQFTAAEADALVQRIRTQ
jgi:preprotein translocase subunit SecD